MVRAVDLIGTFVFRAAEPAGDMVPVRVSVTESNHLRLRVFPLDKCRTGNNRISYHQVPRFWAVCQDILCDRFEETELIEIDPKGLVVLDMVAAAEPETVPIGNFPAVL